jgi:allophanate hydrolase subunit 1
VLHRKDDSLWRLAGDRYVFVEFGDMVLDFVVRAKVAQLEAWLAGQAPEGFVESSPGVRSALLEYDPLVLPLQGMLDLLQRCDAHVLHACTCEASACSIGHRSVALNATCMHGRVWPVVHAASAAAIVEPACSANLPVRGSRQNCCVCAIVNKTAACAPRSTTPSVCALPLVHNAQVCVCALPAVHRGTEWAPRLMPSTYGGNRVVPACLQPWGACLRARGARLIVAGIAAGIAADAMWRVEVCRSTEVVCRSDVQRCVVAQKHSRRAAVPDGICSARWHLRGCAVCACSAEDAVPEVSQCKIDTRVLRLPMAFSESKSKDAMSKYAQSVRPEAAYLPDNVPFVAEINGLSGADAVRHIMYEASYMVLGLGDVYLGAPCAVPVNPLHRYAACICTPLVTCCALHSACHPDLSRCWPVPLLCLLVHFSARQSGSAYLRPM